MIYKRVANHYYAFMRTYFLHICIRLYASCEGGVVRYFLSQAIDVSF